MKIVSLNAMCNNQLIGEWKNEEFWFDFVVKIANHESKLTSELFCKTFHLHLPNFRFFQIRSNQYFFEQKSRNTMNQSKRHIFQLLLDRSLDLVCQSDLQPKSELVEVWYTITSPYLFSHKRWTLILKPNP